MANSIFISYRRSDSQHASIALAESLNSAFADGEVFLDRSSIDGADEWTKSIQNAAAKARMMVLVIGEEWLKAADKHHRRRIDDPKDYVRQEILTALQRNIEVLPLTLDKASVPMPEALDSELALIAGKQALPVRVESWESDLHAVIACIEQKTGLKARRPASGDSLNPNGTPIPRPDRKRIEERVLVAAVLRRELEDIPPWRLEKNHHLWAIGGEAEEIARVYEFRSFSNATRFMAESSDAITGWRPSHHPRWENQWRVVKVWFSTWDVGCRVTQLDIDAAKKMDKLFRDRDPVRCG